MRRLALRRFPNEVVRRRQGPGTRNFYGEFEPGPVVETIYPARVLPLSLEDSDFVGGVSLLERLKVFVPRGIPQDGGDDGDDDPLKMLKADIAGARGKALLVETNASGWGEGRTAAPQRDWQAARLGPMPPESMATIRKDAFEAVLAACGTPPSLFTAADGTSQREAVRRWHLNLVLPLARLVEHELTAKLETPVKLKFDNYPLDLAGRAQAFQKLVAGGVAVNEALATSGLLSDG